MRHLALLIAVAFTSTGLFCAGSQNGRILNGEGVVAAIPVVYAWSDPPFDPADPACDDITGPDSWRITFAWNPNEYDPPACWMSGLGQNCLKYEGFGDPADYDYTSQFNWLQVWCQFTSAPAPDEWISTCDLLALNDIEGNGFELVRWLFQDNDGASIDETTFRVVPDAEAPGFTFVYHSCDSRDTFGMNGDTKTWCQYFPGQAELWCPGLPDFTF